MPHDHGAGAVLDRGWRYDAEVWFFDTFIMRGQIRRLRGRVLDAAEIGPGCRMLDVGCGTGTLAVQAARRVGSGGQLAGIDPGPRQVARARSKTRRANLDIDFREAGIEAIPFDDDSFDAVTSTLMMHHLPSGLKDRGLAEIRRVLKPDGRLVIADFESANGHGHGDGDLAAVIAAAGFTVVTTERITFRRQHKGWTGAVITSAQSDAT